MVFDIAKKEYRIYTDIGVGNSYKLSPNYAGAMFSTLMGCPVKSAADDHCRCWIGACILGAKSQAKNAPRYVNRSSSNMYR